LILTKWSKFSAVTNHLRLFCFRKYEINYENCFIVSMEMPVIVIAPLRRIIQYYLLTRNDHAEISVPWRFFYKMFIPGDFSAAHWPHRSTLIYSDVLDILETFDIVRFRYIERNLEIQYARRVASRIRDGNWNLHQPPRTLFGITPNKWNARAIRNADNVGLREIHES